MSREGEGCPDGRGTRSVIPATSSPGNNVLGLGELEAKLTQLPRIVGGINLQYRGKLTRKTSGGIWRVIQASEIQ